MLIAVALQDILDRKGLMGWVCLSVCPSVTPLLLQRVQNRMSKENKGNQPERELKAEAKHAQLSVDISLYTAYFEAQFT
jgi:hypothetical protein